MATDWKKNHLVYTNYRPKLHDLQKFGVLVGGCDPACLKIFPRATAEGQRCFTLLQRAYVDARYKRHQYKIARRDLEYLAARVRELKKLTRTLCQAKIDSFLSV